MEETSSLFSLSIDPASKSHLTETAKWARFLAIVGFVFIVLMVIVGVYSSLAISGYEDGYDGNAGQRSLMNSLGVGMAVAYLLLSLIAFFPFLFLLRFATNMHNALAANNQSALNDAFLNLKVYFRYLGIIFIICLVMMLLSVFMGIVGSAF